MKAVRQGRGVTGLLMLLALAGCSSRSAEPPPPNPDEVRAKIVRLMPATVRDRQGWAGDIYAAFSARREKYTSDENLCAVLAVTEQESTYQVDPPVAGLGRIATREVERRAGKLHVPAFLVSSALNIKSPDGRTYSQRLAAARTEKELSETFDDFIAIVPMGGKLFGGFNPVHTGGPMQVSIAFAEQHADGYPYPLDGSIRREVFSRRGGMYFGIAHLLGYPADYPAPLYRFADFNAGWYASRNAAFQSAVSRVSGIPLALDGDLIRYGTRTPGSTELAVRRPRQAPGHERRGDPPGAGAGRQPGVRRQRAVPQGLRPGRKRHRQDIAPRRAAGDHPGEPEDHPQADGRLVRQARRRTLPALHGARAETLSPSSRGSNLAPPRESAVLSAKLMEKQRMKTRYSAEAPARDELDRLAGPTLVEFGTDWCGHCQAAQPLLAEVFSDYPEVGHLKVEDGPGRRLGRSFQVKLWPTFVFLRDGREVARVVRPGKRGVLEEAFESLVGEG